MACTVHETVAWHGLTFHQLGLYLAAIFAVIALVVSFYLIMMHATHYLRPWEQRQYVITISPYHHGWQGVEGLTRA